MENITLDPEYENLVIEVNKLKNKVAEKIAERDMLAFHVIPDIESKYMCTIGILENDLFVANLRLLKINREIELYEEKIKFKRPINEREIEEELDAEFDDIEQEYSELQDEEIFFDDDDEFTDKLTEELLKLLNIIYKNLIKKLSPLINFDNTKMDNQLYELSERAYRELDLSMMTKLQTICEQIKPDSNFIIGDVKTLEKTRIKYIELLKENEGIISHIKASETFDKKRILENEELVEQSKMDLNEEISIVEEEIKKSEKKLKKIKKDSKN